MARPGADEEAIARLKIACWREAYPGILPQPVLDGLDVARSTAEWRRALGEGIAWIAEQSGAPVGFGHMRDAEVTTLYVEAAGSRTRARPRIARASLRRDRLSRATSVAHLWVLEGIRRPAASTSRMGGRLVARRPVGFARYPRILEVRYDFALD